MSILEPSDGTLRQWLDNPDRSIDHLECLHIFRQIIEIVNVAHLQGVVIHNIRPSCFVMSSFNCISFIESASCSSSGSDSNNEAVKLVDQNKVGELISSSPVCCGLTQQRRLPAHEDSKLDISPTITYPRDSEGNDQPGVSQSDAETLSCLRSTSAFPMTLSSIETKEYDRWETWRTMPSKQILSMEINWYTSPEEASGAPSTYASDVYRLGVLLFELFSTFSTEDEKLRMMSNLRHRVLPPQLLLKWPKEASFCLWLLHPQPNIRPSMSEVLQSEFLDESRDNAEEREAAIKIKEEIEGQEVLLQFLLQMKQKKQEEADRLHDIVGCLSSDIEEVVVQQSFLLNKNGTHTELEKNNGVGLEKLEALPSSVVLKDSTSLCSRKRSKPSTDVYQSNIGPGSSKSMMTKSSQMMKNFEKLELAYFSTRIKTIRPEPRSQNRGSPGNSTVQGSNMRTEESNFSSIDNLATRGCITNARQSGWVSPFVDGLCKYLSYSRVKVRANLKQADLLNSSNLVCSMSFDRDKEFFATAGVNRKIKVFECNMVLNEDLDIHYPVIEMSSRSKVSSVCWNSYIKNQIASSDFDGVVQVWDSTRGQAFMDLREHEKRVWSVDFSRADPTRLASGGDDCAVKLWNINQGASIGTIRTKANVCCVQFPPNSAHTIAVGSADHKVYLYDLRNTRVPCCTLVSHMKTVSCVKFIDSTTLVSASTDNTLKLWDLSVDSSRVIASPAQTFKGHTNLKNFVGLSVSDGYIATGSETNEVFIYYKAFPMPVLSYKFDSNDPLTGQEIYDAPQFISCVCWRGQSSILVAANSTGNIKILEMV
ncbi:protein SPA1-RELATED 4 isoform X1 [Nymphaea colorata]|nr:protein SPA1-RELATED 4 isoform X1 [Nymphaea colorata]XP_031493721.1 protein SPA1-RELATED 4 isoform X1 [Nymphaea colorata]XP_031493722.1 protein SPA1-RELATED 4 isoform X1 [Nymphaea colorata]XP_031493723.1 protein SPA1-RELATED 4 isoform X1 [Nymphaea colorata]